MTGHPSTERPAAAGAIEVIGRVRIVPVLTVDDAGEAVALVRALADGGLTAVEITLRTPAAVEAIRRATNAVPGAIVGAGSVTSAGLAGAALDAGARFLVSPGLDDGTIEYARSRSAPVLPGVATATELLRAVHLGLDVVKLFPAEQIGGPALIEAFAAVWPDVRFIPTGGVTAASAPAYLALPHVLAVGGSWMVNRRAVGNRDWESVVSDAVAAAGLGGQPT